MGLWRAFLCFWRHLTVKGLLHLDFFLVQQPLLLPVSCGKKCYGEILRDGICVDFALYVINGADGLLGNQLVGRTLCYDAPLLHGIEIVAVAGAQFDIVQYT